MIEIRDAREQDFEVVFPLIKKLWSYNTYEEEATREVFIRILDSAESFAFLVWKDGKCIGFCHGDYFPTLWMCGMTCYLSGIITDEAYRGRGVGALMMEHVKELARSKGCKAIILDSGLPRTEAHRFYEGLGFEKSCYGFEMGV